MCLSLSLKRPSSRPSQIPAICSPAVNRFLEEAGKTPLFEVELVGITKETKLQGSAFSVHTDRLLHEVKKTDLIFIPALSGDMKRALELNKELVPWIVQQYCLGAEVASLCIGAFLLAETGLLKGKKCSTHWNSAHEFRTMFPDVELVDQSIITEEQGLYSSGGANSYWNLLLYLVEKYTDRDTAIMASKYFAIDIHRESQSAFMMFKGQKGHEDEEVKRRSVLSRPISRIGSRSNTWQAWWPWANAVSNAGSGGQPTIPSSNISSG